MTTPDAMGLTPEAAAGYEEFFVPAIFGQWPPRIIEAAQLAEGDRVLEVGCGTGVFAREAVKHVGATGSVTGFDLSESMLGVARVHCPGAIFQQGDAANLPFADDAFDVVASSFMLMFAPEPERVIGEMLRVLKPHGRLVVAVWESLADNPAYSALADIVRRHVDDAAAVSLGQPFVLGADGQLDAMLQSAGAIIHNRSKHNGRARFPSVDSFVTTEIRAWLLADSVDDQRLAAMIKDARERFTEYSDRETGALDMPLNAIIATAANP